MPVAPQEVLDLAQAWVRAGGMPDQAFVARHAWTEDRNAVHTFASGPAAVTLDQLIEHLGEVPPRENLGSNPAGFVWGDAAWVTDTYQVDMLHEGIIDIRCTVVLVRKDGEWKVVHNHVSEAVKHQM